MNIENHPRITRIRKLSGYLKIFFTLLYGAFFFAWIAAAFRLLNAPTGVTPFIVVFSSAAGSVSGGMTAEAKIMMVLLFSVTVFFIFKTIFHVSELMACFSRGEIFNNLAVKNARTASRNLLYAWGFVLFMDILGFISGRYFEISNSPVMTSRGIMINVCLLVFIGLMYVLTWSLEIGRELYDDSELTI